MLRLLMYAAGDIKKGLSYTPGHIQHIMTTKNYF